MKKIRKPAVDGAVKLSAVELNKIHFSEKRTILTPELLEKLAESKS
ncbi:MAG: hypothetical protein NC248_06280 [Bacteroides sp.]|nr:hypothetical protein [Bacteroides sp.]MCM1389269.1 hypothetical protein [Bacteroides sp.]